jgi:DNA-binding IclR family transcriptional regulator
VRPRTPNGGTRTPGVQSVRRALGILGLFPERGPHLNLQEICDATGLHKSTVHRLVTTMVGEGFLRAMPGDQYALGWNSFILGRATSEFYGLEEVVGSALSSVTAETGETSHLAIRDADRVLYVAKVVSARHLHMPSAVGRRVPLHCTALGKVLLAGLPEAEMLRMVYSLRLERLTEHTITSPDVLRELIMQVKVRGYAVDEEEIEDGLACVAAPLLTPQGAVCAAISIAGPASRVMPLSEKHADVIIKACKRLTDQLGGSVDDAGRTFCALLSQGQAPTDNHRGELDGEPFA